MDKLEKQFVTFLRQKPALGKGVFIAKGAVVFGHVTIGDYSSVWYGAVARGDINRIAIGHYEPFLNYELSALNTNAETSTTTASVQAISKARKIKSENQKKKISQTINFPQAQLVPKHAEDPTLSPIFNVAVNPRLIPNHNKIDRTIFIQFLAEFITLYSSDEKQ